MSYISDETSVHDGKPKELYRFEGTYGNYFYTTQQEEATYLGEAYEPATMRRSAVKTGTKEDDGLDCNIEMPVSIPLARDYAFRTTPPRLWLTIYRYHTLDDVKTYWSGPVVAITVQRGRATLRSPSALNYALGGNCPSIYYQTPCNRVLFDEGCKVSRIAHSVATTVVDVNGRSLSVASIGGKPAGYFIGGELVAASGERRMIIGQAGTDITLNYPFARLSKTQTVTLVAGCDHAYEGDCANKFANQKNFGGFPFVPTVNPFTDGIG